MVFQKSIILASLIVFIAAGAVFSQGEQVIQGPPLQQAGVVEQQLQWVWGEVVLEPANNTLTVKYLDYENDAEKEIAITADENTVYENIKSLSELKPKDTVSIDYIVTSEGKNIAKNISVEKVEDTQESEEGSLPAEEKLPALPAQESTP